MSSEGYSMNKIVFAALCAFLIVALAIPVVQANSTTKATDTVTKYGHKAYRGGATIATNTEKHVTGILRNAFSLFNPCMDLVKSCSNTLFYPLDYTYKAVVKSKPAAKKVETPAPEQPAQAEKSVPAKKK